jgi:4-amino-4-deoxy-L-arabinose transferase-like glycosyltransferase
MTLWQLWWLALAVKTALLPFVPITPDEAYYFAWARHPALSYLDHPPFIAWLMTLGLPLWKTAITMRWPGVLFNHLGFIPWFGILKRFNFSEKAKVYWMLALLLGPLTGLGSFIVTPDLPLMFFWSMALWALLSATEEPESLMRWTVLGLALGLGLLSKYMMILFYPATVIWMFWDHKQENLRKAGPWLATLVALALFFPVIYWNSQNHFASFLFQTRHGLQAEDFKWRWPLEFMGSQLGLINPLIFIVGLWVLCQRPWKTDSKYKFLVVFSALPFFFFILTSFRARAEANWAVCAFPTFTALAMSVIDQPKAFGLWKTWLKSGIAIAGIFVAIIISHSIHPWLPLNKNKDHTQIMHEWLVDVPAIQNAYPLYARSYQMAAFHSYYRDENREVFKLAGLDRIDVYDFLPQSHPHSKGFVILKPEDRVPAAVLQKYSFTNPRTLPSGMVLFELTPQIAHIQ